MNDSVELTLKEGHFTQLHPEYVKGQCATPGCPEPTAHWMNKDGFLAMICCQCWRLKKGTPTAVCASEPIFEYVQCPATYARGDLAPLRCEEQVGHRGRHIAASDWMDWDG